MFKILLWIFVLGLIAFVASVFPRSMCTLTWMIFLPLVTAGVCLVIPSSMRGLIKLVAVVGAILTLIIASLITRDYIEAEKLAAKGEESSLQGAQMSAASVLGTDIRQQELLAVDEETRAKVVAQLELVAAENDTTSYFALANNESRTAGQTAALNAIKEDLGDAGVHALERTREVELAAGVKQAHCIRYVEYGHWIGDFKINYFLGVDGFSMPLIWLTALLSVLCLIYSWTVDKGTKAYFVLFLLLETGLIGVFCALDFFLFYVFWEIVLLPMYFLIGIWGGPNRIYAAIKFFIYTLVGSVLMLLAMLVLYFWQDPHTFNMLTLMETAPTLSLTVQVWLFLALFIGFAIKVPVVPFHTWLPDAHVEAPTAISVLLAGVLLKMGGYGLFRVCYPMLPDAAMSTGIVWMIGFLGMFSIVYGAFCALAQKDFKKLVAYSSVSHMGFVLLGLAAFSHTGVMGAVLQMFTHGISSAMLFFVVGVIYERAHHRNLDDFGGIGLQMPWYTGIATVGFFASLGLPGLCGFISEALTFVGAWDDTGLLNSQNYSGSINANWMIIVSLLGIVLTAAYILWTIQRVYLGSIKEKYKEFKDVTDREVIALVPLAILCVLIGVFPHQIIISHISRSLNAMTDMVRATLS